MSEADEENELIAHKWVRILADSCADGVWVRDGGATSADQLPVSQDLIDRIRQWQAWYDRDQNDWGLFNGDVEAFSNEGREIARAVKAALPDWTVVYFDEAASASASDDAPRAVFEYKV
jgi:uncharacterized protein YfaT (DUF1175 family)